MKSTLAEKALVGVLATFLAFGIVIACSLYEAFCLRLLWLWFITEKFGLPSLSYLNAIGVSLVVSLLTHQTIYTPTEVKDKHSTAIAGLLRPAIFLFLGWAFKHFLS